MQLTFIMGVNTGRVEDHRIIGIEICCDIAVPSISMHQTRPNTPPTGLQRSQQSRNDLLKSSPYELLHPWIRTLGLFFIPYEIL